MQAFPHHYRVGANAQPESNVQITAGDLPGLVSSAPAEFDGPGDQWSPEELLVAAVADCFILTFKAVAAASRLDWTDLQCEAEGTLDRVDRVTRFTAFTVRARLTLPAGGDTEKATRLLEKAESACLVTNSLHAETHLETDVVSGD